MGDEAAGEAVRADVDVVVAVVVLVEAEEEEEGDVEEELLEAAGCCEEISRRIMVAVLCMVGVAMMCGGVAACK